MFLLMFIEQCRFQSVVARRMYAPDNFAFASILPHTLLDNTTPSLVHNKSPPSALYRG